MTAEYIVAIWSCDKDNNNIRNSPRAYSYVPGTEYSPRIFRDHNSVFVSDETKIMHRIV